MTTEFKQVERLNGHNQQQGRENRVDYHCYLDKSITIQRAENVTIVSTRDKTTGMVSTETFFGDSPYGD